MKVLDSSAVLAFLLGENGGDVARSAFSTGAISAVNFCEVLSRYAKAGVAPADAAPHVAGLGMSVEPFTAEQAVIAAEIYDRTRLSLGDRACVALAKTLNAPVLTGDRIWATLSLPVPVELIR